MLQLRIPALISFGLGLPSLFAVGVCHLALTDIHHGEADTSLEWGAVQICFVVIIAFQVSALVTLWQVLRGGSGLQERA